MKRRHAEWLKLTAAVTPSISPSLPAIRIREFPGIDELERKLLLYSGRGQLPIDLDERMDEISVALFGIKREQTLYQKPADYYLLPKDELEFYEEEHESRYETSELDQDQAVAFLKTFGLDFSDEGGKSLLCTWYLKRQAEAAAKGFMGKMPDRAQAGLDTFASKLEADARAFLSRRGK